MATTERLIHCNCFAARKAARLITKLYEDHLAEAGLTSTQFSILAFVDEAGAAAMKDLVDVLQMERTSVVRALQPLERDGLVASGPDDADARRNVVRLTKAGQARLAQAIPLWRVAQAEFERRVGADTAAGLRQSMLALATE